MSRDGRPSDGVSMTDKVPVSLSGAAQTMLTTLYLKALDADFERPVLGDVYAKHAVDRLDYDWREIGVPARWAPLITVRTAQYDMWARQFLAVHEHAAVVHLGCGLDSRVFRVDPPPSVEWYDIDFPGVIALREKIFPTRSGYHLIAASATDPWWLDRIPADRPLLLLAEGISMYLREHEGVALLRRVVERFPSGELQIDFYNRLAIRSQKRHTLVRRSGSALYWAVDSPDEIVASVPGVRLLTAVSLFDARPFTRASAGFRIAKRLVRVMPPVRKALQYHRYAFGAGDSPSSAAGSSTRPVDQSGVTTRERSAVMRDFANDSGGDRRPRVLLVYYTYTGQALKALESVAEVFRDRGCEVRLAGIEFTDRRYAAKFSQFPMRRVWPDMLSVLPAQLRRATAEIRIPDAARDGHYDLICIGSPTWWRTTNMPMRSFLKSDVAEKLFADTPFVTLVVCRRYWRENIRTVRRLGQKRGGRYMGGMYFDYPGGQVRSMLSLTSYLGSGEYRDRYLGLRIPTTNVQSQQLEQARGFALALADKLFGHMSPTQGAAAATAEHAHTETPGGT